MARAARRTKRQPSRPEKTLSLRAFGSLVDASLAAVQKGIKAGRLDKSVGRTPNGTPFIADPDLALREWKAGATRPPNDGGSKGTRKRTAPARTTQASTLTQAQLRVAGERETALRI